MDRRCAAGALVALAACIATTAAAPTASNQTALDLYEGASEGCYYNFQHYGEGDRIMTNEPCLNCTCHNRMLMCYLRVCPFTKPIGQDCSVEKRADQCCPIVTCPDVPVDLLTSTSTSSPSEYGETGVGKLDRYGCSINGKYFPEGSKVPPSPNKPCEHCYCIRNMTTCVMQECTLHVDGCTPIYRKDVCCPVRYSCDHPEDEIPLLDDMTTTVRPTPGFLLTTTTLSPVTQMTQDCVHDDKIFADGALIKTEKACEHCYCMKGDIVCVVQECGTPMENEGKNCTSMPPREGQCCPDTYICEGDEQTTETKPDIATVTSFEDLTTLSPPRRVSVEGSGYRSETDEPSTVGPIFEPDSEGSGEDQLPIKPTDIIGTLNPESESSPPFITTTEDVITEKYRPNSTEKPESDGEKPEVTTEADKGENTVPSGDIYEDTSDTSEQDKISHEIKSTTIRLEAPTESSGDMRTTALPKDEIIVKDKTTTREELTATESFITDTTTTDEEMPITEPGSIVDHDLNTSLDNKFTSEAEITETTLPSRRNEDDEVTPAEITTLIHYEEPTTKAGDIITPDTVFIKSTTLSFKEHDDQTSTSKIAEKESELNEPTTEANLELTTEPNIITPYTQSVTTVKSEIETEFSTSSKVDLSDTTSANPIENEIDEESFPTLAPGRIPGEGDCLLDGVTYSHESIVPSSSNCHTSCRCISSIVKCEPIICSPPPDYMDNCQPMYDSPESCCPTYVCDHPRETVPPQSHSQMAGTESPISTPTIECNGDQCEIVKDKEQAKPPVLCTSEGCTDDSNQTPDKTSDCGFQGCSEIDKEPEKSHPSEPAGECTGDSCQSPPDAKPPVLCTSEGCTGDSNQTPDKTADCGHQGCGEIEKEPEKSHPSEPAGECTGDRCQSPPMQCASGKCETTIPKDHTCNNENGCEIPVVQECQGDNCATQPDVTATKDDSTSCDNPENCKVEQIPAKASDCTGESCISESPSQTIPYHKQDCKNGDNCAQQKPGIEECKEEDCQRQQVPEIDRPAPSDCTGSDCIQQPDNVPQITNVPELTTESAPSVTELPKDSETKSEEPVTDLPKTTTKEAESSSTTKASISEKEEDVGTTPQSNESHDNKPKESEQTTTESSGIVPQTSESQVQESITEGYIDQETIKEILPEVTQGPSEAPLTDIPSLSDKVTKEATTEQPSFEITQSPESTTLIDDAHTDVSVTRPENYTDDKNAVDITTAEPHLSTTHSTSPGLKQETTELHEMPTQAPESLDRDGHDTTKEPEYVQDTEPKVTEPTERFTPEQEQVTDKLDVEPVQEQYLHEAPTTSKLYDSATNIPESLETASVSTSEEPITDKPDHTMQTIVDGSLPDVKEDTEAPVSGGVYRTTAKPDIAFDGSETQSPELNITPGKETITMAPVRDISGEPETETESSKPLVTLPIEIATEKSDADKTSTSVTVNVQTQTPMSIVKDHDDNEISSTITPESGITTERDEIITKEPKSPESEPVTEFAAKPSEISSEQPVSDLAKEPSVSEIEHDATTTEKSTADLETKIPEVAGPEFPTKQPVHDTEVTIIPKTETSTDSVPIITEMVSLEPSITEAGIQELSTQQEHTSESAPVTSAPNDDIETKSPDTVTESSVQPSSEGIETVTSVKTYEDTDVTELPELVVHEHPTEPTDKITTNPPDIADKEPQHIIPDENTSYATPEGSVTVAPEVSISETQKETTGTSEQDIATKAPEITHSETTKSKPDDASYTPESFTTVSQKVTEYPESQTVVTKAPEIAATEAQKEATDEPAIQVTVATTGPKISATETQDAVTEGLESQHTVSDADAIVTQSHEATTEVLVSHDMVTTAPDTIKRPHSETTERPEESGTEEKDITKIYDTTTIAPEISPTEPHKKLSVTPESEDMATKVSDTSPVETDKEATEEPISQDLVTSVPKTSASEPQEETTKVPEVKDSTTIVSETQETDPKKVTTPAVQDRVTSIPEIPTTGFVPTEDTHIFVVQDEASTVPAIPVTTSEKQAIETPTRDDSSIPAVHTTEPEQDATESPADHSVTNVPETLITDSDKDTQAPETQDTETNASVLPDTEPKKDMTEAPEAGSTIPEIATTVPNQAVTDIPEIQVYTDAPSDSKTPETNAVAQDVVTYAPEPHDMATNPELSTKSEEQVTETPEKVITEPHSGPTQPEERTTEIQREVTEIPEISHATGTNTPEMLATKSDKDVTETSEEVSTTGIPEISQTEKPVAIEKDGSSTETSLKFTTEFDGHTQSDLQEFVTPTEPSHDISRPVGGESPVEQDGLTPVTESPATESPNKITGSDSDINKPLTGIESSEKKPEERPEVDTEISTVEPIKTDSTIPPQQLEPEKAPESVVSETSATDAPESTVTEKDHTQAPEDGSRRTEATSAPVDAVTVEPIKTDSTIPSLQIESEKAPESIASEISATDTPESTVTEKDHTQAPEQGSRRTEATTAPVDEVVVTKAPETESQDETTKTSEEPMQTTESKENEEHPETTPYLVLLEEHTHKTVSPDGEITTSPSDVPLKEYEPSTPDAYIDQVTESVPVMETEKSPQDVISDKDQSVTELAQTTISDRITTISQSLESVDTEKPLNVESNEISTSTPTTHEEPTETEKPSVSSVEVETEKEGGLTSEKPSETNIPVEDFILASSKATTIKPEGESTTLTPLLDKFGKPDEEPQPAAQTEKPKPDTTDEASKPGANEVQPTEEAIQPEEESHFPPSGTSGYGQEPDYGEEDSFGPGTCRYGGKVYVSAQQIPRDDPCDFCFCFRSDIICLQQSCPPPIHGCHEEPIQGFCCPRYECPVSMATTLNVTTTTTTTTTTLPPHFLPHAYKGAAQRRGCQIKGHTYKVGEVVRASSGPCLHCTCGGDGQMKCDPKVCTPEPMLRQMIAAAVSAKRRR